MAIPKVFGTETEYGIAAVGHPISIRSCPRPC